MTDVTDTTDPYIKTILFIHNTLFCQFNNIIRALNTKYHLYFICFKVPSGIEIKDNILRCENFHEDSLESNGIEVLNMATKLKKRGIIPDVIVTHVGYGIDKFIETIYPDIPVIGYVEWYYDVINTTHLIRNSYIRDRVEKSAMCICPTRSQKIQFPTDLRKKILVMHEGINSELFNPDPTIWPVSNDEIQRKTITYVSRGLEPMRGFMEFIRGIKLVFEADAKIQVCIVGHDKVFYNDNPENISYKTQAESLLAKYKNHVKFTGALSPKEVADIFQHSNLHIYFTKPYPLSWSFMEAMNMGCLILGSDNTAVREFMKDGFNGRLVDFTDANAVKTAILEMLNMDTEAELEMRANARRVALAKVEQSACVSKWETLIESIIL